MQARLNLGSYPWGPCHKHCKDKIKNSSIWGWNGTIFGRHSNHNITHLRLYLIHCSCSMFFVSTCWSDHDPAGKQVTHCHACASPPQEGCMPTACPRGSTQNVPLAIDPMASSTHEVRHGRSGRRHPTSTGCLALCWTWQQRRPELACSRHSGDLPKSASATVSQSPQRQMSKL